MALQEMDRRQPIVFLNRLSRSWRIPVDGFENNMKYRDPRLAKPSIPLEHPQPREVPEIADPIPRKLPNTTPTPADPMITPREPVPTRR